MNSLVLSSGGLDSTVALALAVQKAGAENVTALSVLYGQKHDRELRSARAVAEHYGVRQLHLDLCSIFQYSDSSLLRASAQDIPKESYARQLARTGGAQTVSTYVPFRNGLFLSAAASVALSLGCQVLYYGAHADDAAGCAYPDCSPAFHAAMDAAIRSGSGQQLRVEAPFLRLSKAEVVRIGLELGVPFELTWSCYEGGERPCGRCGTCIDRARAFAANGVADPAL